MILGIAHNIIKKKQIMKKGLSILLFIFLSLRVNSQQNQFKTIDVLLLKGQYQTALKQLENQPKNYQVFDKIGDIYQTIGNYTKAIIYYKKADAFNHHNDTKVKLAKVYSLAGFKTKALNTYQSIIATDSLNHLVFNSLGKIYLSDGHPAKAEKIYSFLITKDSLNPNYQYQLGMALLKQNKLIKMGQHFLEAYKLDSMHLRSIYQLAKFFKKIRDKDSTDLFISKGLAIDSLSINFNLLKAQNLYYTKQFKGAIKVLNKLKHLDYTSVTTYEMLGMCYYNLKDYASAEKAFKKGLKLDYGNSQLHYRLASLYYDQNKIKLAEMSDYMSIFNATPKLDKQYFLLGLIANTKHDLKNAVKYFKKAFTSNSNNYKALFQLALVTDSYYKDKKKGLALYQKYLYRFKSKNTENTLFANARVKAIKKKLFLKGESFDQK